MKLPIECYLGYRLVETNAITKRIQKRIHKKRRINKKWLKRYGYKTVLDNETIIMSNNTIFATPKTVKIIIEQMKGGVQE